MLNFQPYYYRIIRRHSVAFGSMFNNMSLVKYVNDYTATEQSRTTVPLIWAPKEDYYTRLSDNPDLAKPVGITLPRASYAMTGFQYDPSRQQQATLSNYTSTSGTGVNQQYQAVPYDINYELAFYVRNFEDGAQLVEQIVPFFNPQYTLAINLVPEMGITRNVPLILNKTDFQIDYEGAAKDTIRMVVWTLGFTFKTYFFGPINKGGLITHVNTNILLLQTGTQDSELQLNLANSGLGQFQQGEIVYQGGDGVNPSNYATVSYFDPAGVLTLTNINGSFIAGANVVGIDSQASWAVSQTTPDIVLAAGVTVPVPANASSNQSFMSSTYWTEYPKTI